jgi:hypothetical protein
LTDLACDAENNNQEDFNNLLEQGLRNIRRRATQSLIVVNPALLESTTSNTDVNSNDTTNPTPLSPSSGDLEMGRGRGRKKNDSQGWKVRPPLSEVAVKSSSPTNNNPLHHSNSNVNATRKNSRAPIPTAVTTSIAQEEKDRSGPLRSSVDEDIEQLLWTGVPEEEGDEDDAKIEIAQADAEKHFLDGIFPFIDF